jgi:hypothetical protein
MIIKKMEMLREKLQMQTAIKINKKMIKRKEKITKKALKKFIIPQRKKLM